MIILNFSWLIKFILFLPLIGFLAVFIPRRIMSQRSLKILALGMLSLVIIIILGYSITVYTHLRSSNYSVIVFKQWIQTANLAPKIIFLIDPLALSVLFTAAISTFFALLMIPSVGLSEEKNRYLIGLINLLFFFLVILFFGGSLLITFTGWIGISLSLYMLLSLTFSNDSDSNDSLVRFLLYFLISDSLYFVTVIFVLLHNRLLDYHVLSSLIKMNLFNQTHLIETIIGLSLLFSVFIKCALFPFLGWLPNKQKIPAATQLMIYCITIPSGIYIFLRSNFLLEQVYGIPTIMIVAGLISAVVSMFFMFQLNQPQQILPYFSIYSCSLLVVSIGAGLYLVSIISWFVIVFSIMLIMVSIHYSKENSRAIGKGLCVLAGLSPLGGFAALVLIQHKYDFEFLSKTIVTLILLIISISVFVFTFFIYHSIFRKKVLSKSEDSLFHWITVKNLWVDNFFTSVLIYPIFKIGDYLWAFDNYFNNLLFQKTSLMCLKWSEITVAFERWFFDSVFSNGWPSGIANGGKRSQSLTINIRLYAAIIILTSVISVILYLILLQFKG